MSDITKHRWASASIISANPTGDILELELDDDALFLNKQDSIAIARHSISSMKLTEAASFLQAMTDEFVELS